MLFLFSSISSCYFVRCDSSLKRFIWTSFSSMICFRFWEYFKLTKIEWFNFEFLSLISLFCYLRDWFESSKSFILSRASDSLFSIYSNSLFWVSFYLVNSSKFCWNWFLWLITVDILRCLICIPEWHFSTSITCRLKISFSRLNSINEFSSSWSFNSFSMICCFKVLFCFFFVSSFSSAVYILFWKSIHWVYNSKLFCSSSSIYF